MRVCVCMIMCVREGVCVCVCVYVRVCVHDHVWGVCVDACMRLYDYV